MLFVLSLVSYKTILVSDEKPGAHECTPYKTPANNLRVAIHGDQVTKPMRCLTDEHCAINGDRFPAKPEPNKKMINLGYL